jgi:hypothetical protein
LFSTQKWDKKESVLIQSLNEMEFQILYRNENFQGPEILWKSTKLMLFKSQEKRAAGHFFHIFFDIFLPKLSPNEDNLQNDKKLKLYVYNAETKKYFFKLNSHVF